MGFTQNPCVGGYEMLPRRKKLSPAAWSFILMFVDGSFLMLVLTLFLGLALSPYLDMHVSYYSFGILESRRVWILLALLSWNVAIRIVRTRKFMNALGRWGNPLHAVGTFLLILIFWMFLTYPFVTDKFAYVRTGLLFFILAALVLGAWRMFFTGLMSLPRFRCQAIIVGMNTAGEIIAKELESTKDCNIQVLGYIHESSSKEVQKENGLPVLGDRSVLTQIAQRGMIDVIIMAIDYNVNSELFQEIIGMSQLGISVVPMVTLYERLSGKISVEHVGDQWHVALPSERAISPLYLCWRTIMDITFGLCGLVALGLAWLVLAPLIVLSSPGPVFYKQERVGYQGRKYSIFKFRSMYRNAEEAGKAKWASEDDPRVTSIGRFMRASHLDELPQVLNILRGEMSLIGPRPERQEFITELEKIIPFYRCRLSVKPGLTGWAQVMFPYTDTDDGSLIKLQYDLYYIKHQSFTLDISIIMKTVVEILFSRGR